jgi:hypothetical protein
MIKKGNKWGEKNWMRCATPYMQLLGHWKESAIHFQEQDMLKTI